MTTATEAYNALKQRLIDAALGVPLRWQGDNKDSNGNVELPDTPATFIYSEMIAEPAELVAYGGGPLQNLYRNPARFVSYVFIPRNTGLTTATDLAEAIAQQFRSYRTAQISCFDATVHPGGDGAQLTPPGLTSEVNNYFWASTEVSLFFDQLG